MKAPELSDVEDGIDAELRSKEYYDGEGNLAFTVRPDSLPAENDVVCEPFLDPQAKDSPAIRLYKCPDCDKVCRSENWSRLHRHAQEEHQTSIFKHHVLIASESTRSQTNRSLRERHFRRKRKLSELQDTLTKRKNTSNTGTSSSFYVEVPILSGTESEGLTTPAIPASVPAPASTLADFVSAPQPVGLPVSQPTSSTQRSQIPGPIDIARIAEAATLRVRTFNASKRNSMLEKTLSEIQQQRSANEALAQKLRKLEIDNQRSKRIADEAIERMKKQELEMKKQELESNKRLQNLAQSTKVLGEISVDRNTRILVADTNWLVWMGCHQINALLTELSQYPDIYLFIPSVVRDELDRIKSKKTKLFREKVTGIIDQLGIQHRSLICHTSRQLSDQALARLHALSGVRDNQILEIYCEVSKCTIRAPVFLSKDKTFQQKVTNLKGLFMQTNRIADIMACALGDDSE
jgi:rRNA-processing protein FCF1